MPLVTGQLTDFGFDALDGHAPKLVFRHNSPGLSGVAVLATKAVEVVPEYNGYFEADLLASSAVMPAGYYTITVEWTELPTRHRRRETLPWKLYVPAAGGALADLLRIPANPDLAPGVEPPVPADWWHNEMTTTLANAVDELEASTAERAGTPGTDLHTVLSATTVSAIEDSQGGIPAAGPLTVPTYDGNPSTGHPSIVEVPGSLGGYRYWMAHTPYPFAIRENPSIVASHNGIDWELPEGAPDPVTPYSEIQSLGFNYGSDTHLIHHEGKLWMYYRLASSSLVKNAIFLKTSTDGVNWSVATKVLEDLTAETTLNSPCVEVEADGTFSMWTANYTIQPPVIQRRTSATGTGAWSAPVACTLPAGALVWHIDIKRIGKTYHCLFNSAEQYQGDQLYYLTSPDGLTWTGDIKHPAVESDGGTFPLVRYYRSALVPRLGVPQRWDVYTTMVGDDGGETWRIGLIRDTTLPTPRQEIRRQGIAQARTDALLAVAQGIAGDNFGRADNAAGLGVSTSGHAWVTLSGTPQIKDRAPYATGTTRAYIETGAADVEVSADITAMGEVFLMVRVVDGANWWRVGTDQASGRVVVQKYVAGAFGAGGFTGSPNIGSGRPLRVGDRLRVIVKGDQWEIYRNTLLVTKFTDSFNSTATKHGLNLSASTGQVKAFGITRAG